MSCTISRRNFIKVAAVTPFLIDPILSLSQEKSALADYIGKEIFTNYTAGFSASWLEPEDPMRQGEFLFTLNDIWVENSKKFLKNGFSLRKQEGIYKVKSADGEITILEADIRPAEDYSAILLARLGSEGTLTPGSLLYAVKADKEQKEKEEVSSYRFSPRIKLPALHSEKGLESKTVQKLTNANPCRDLISFCDAVLASHHPYPTPSSPPPTPQ